LKGPRSWSTTGPFDPELHISPLWNLKCIRINQNN
jgi:hypothetical protein